MPGVLEGIRVLDFGRYIAGPYCAALLGEHGADVIRVEKREGLWVFRGMPGWTFARGGVCVGGCFLTGDGRVTDRLLRHEAVHKRQWEHYGFLMPFLYLFAGRDPLRNRFEIEAGLEDGNYLPRGAA